MLLVAAAELWMSWRTALDAANAAYDRSLLGAVKSIDANIETESGGLAVELPYRMLEFFQLTASGPVRFRVSTEDGLVTVGDEPMPPVPKLVTGVPRIVDEQIFGEPVRVASLARELDPPLAGAHQRVIIQVAEPLTLREDFTRRLVLQALTRDLLLIGVACVLLVVAITYALRPVDRLRRSVRARAPQDLAPIETAGLPTDVQPLINALNHHIERSNELLEARRRFVDDASHQLRTPLATLVTQLGYARREADPERRDAALAALKDQLDETVRQTNQMLALARADSAGIDLRPVDLPALGAALLRQCWREARERGIDLGLDSDETQAAVQVLGQPELLREALANLLHNALRHVPPGGRVTIEIGGDNELARIAVADDGPGIPEDEISHAGERFYRASNTVGQGSGIGLAVVRSIAQRHGGQMRVGDGIDGRGLRVTIEWPRQPDIAVVSQ